MWKSVIWSDECRFKLIHSDGRIRVWRQINERFLNQCIKKTVKWEWSGAASAVTRLVDVTQLSTQ